MNIIKQKINDLKSFKTSDEEIQPGDYILYTGDLYKNKGLNGSKITRCMKIESIDNKNRIFYKDNIGYENWLDDSHFKKLVFEKINYDNIQRGDFALSIQDVGENARLLYEVVPICAVNRRRDGINGIGYLNKSFQHRTKYCKKDASDVGLLKVFPIFKDDSIFKNDENDMFDFLNKDNSYISIVKNLIK